MNYLLKNKVFNPHTALSNQTTDGMSHGMLPSPRGSIRLFSFAGIEVFLHWSWFLVALFSVNNRGHEYSSRIMPAVEYIALFGIVLLHEFGHALACRQVGGHSDRIILWPLGGVAYVDPPQRPGAVLWSIAAGPLVNLVLAPVMFGIFIFGVSSGWFVGTSDLGRFIQTLGYINVGLFLFNMLPVYPLDGGQILRALLWFWLGPLKSLSIASAIGIVGSLALVLLAFSNGMLMLGIIALFILQQSFSRFRALQALARATPSSDV